MRSPRPSQTHDPTMQQLCSEACEALNGRIAITEDPTAFISEIGTSTDLTQSIFEVQLAPCTDPAQNGADGPQIPSTRVQEFGFVACAV